MNKPIFCIVGRSGVGKSTYLDLLINNNHGLNLKELKYCTTRRKRYAEEDSYYFMTEKEYDNIPGENIIESRTYQKYDEWVRYFTTKDNINIQDCDALICAASVNQALSYRKKLDNVYVIDIAVNLKDRLKRLLDRTHTDNEILEICRRTLEEVDEYSNLMHINDRILHIHNDNTQFNFSNTGTMLYSLITSANLKIMEDYIRDHI